MTSLLRRKHQTTRPNSRPTNDIKPRPLVAESRESRVESREPEAPSAIGNRRFAWLLLAAVALVSYGTASANELEWRRGRTGESKSAHPAASKRVAHHRSKQKHVDRAVRPAAYEDEGGPQFTPGTQGSGQFRSVIVDRRQDSDSLRSAQLSTPGAPSAPAGSPPSTSGTDTQLDQDLRSPFNDTPAEMPPLQGQPPEDLETPPLPDDSQTQPDRFERQPDQLPTTEFQPRGPGQRETGPPLPADVPRLSEDTLAAEREKSQAACSQGFSDLKEKTIDKLDLSIAVGGEQGSDYPYECAIEDAWHEGRCWEQTTYLWKASALCHKPLYFEQEQLERYGHSWSPCFAPFCAGAHFFTRLPVLPYCMGVEPPCECIYSLGHYRPGNCAPYMCNPIPLSPRGALFQAGAVVGTAAVLP